MSVIVFNKLWGIIMYEKILVPIDGSDYSIRALHESIKIAKLTNGAITLIHVYPIGKSIVTSSSQPYFQKLIEECKEKLANGKEIAKVEGLDAETLLFGGNIVEQIIKTAKEGKFELIVIGARGLGKISGLILGSVSQGVVSNSPCSVLVTR
jgi:nucleotide-binding universal stress UspA family protein